MLLKVDCLPTAVGKQPSIPLIYLGRKWTLNWWWWWWFGRVCNGFKMSPDSGFWQMLLIDSLPTYILLSRYLLPYLWSGDCSNSRFGWQWRHRPRSVGWNLREGQGEGVQTESGPRLPSPQGRPDDCRQEIGEFRRNLISKLKLDRFELSKSLTKISKLIINCHSIFVSICSCHLVLYVPGL